MKLAGVVVLYNPTVDDINNIDSYKKYLDHLYVVDNSTQNNKNLFDKMSNVSYFSFTKNIGLASALNYACKRAYDAEYEWILTMDQDSKFKNFKGFLDSFKQIDLKNVAVVSPWHKTEYKIEKPEKNIESVDYVMTSGNLVNLKKLERVGWFLDWLFIDGIDMELCFKVKKHGYDIVRINEVELQHFLGNFCKHTLFKRDFETTNHSAIRRYYISRNMMYLKKMYEDMNRDFFRINSNTSKTIFKIICFEKNKIKKIYMIFLGKLHYYFGRKGKL